MNLVTNKTELLSTFDNRKEQYSKKIRLKGSFFLFEGNYYPIKLIFLPAKGGEHYSRQDLNYGDLLLIEDNLDIDDFNKFINCLGENCEFATSSFKIKIPKGDFQTLQNGNRLERNFFKETRSFPKTSIFRQWPTRSYIFKLEMPNSCEALFNRKLYEPVTMKEELPLIPDYYTALNWWFGRDIFYLNDWRIIFYLPDFKARIKEVRYANDSFVIDIEGGLLKAESLRGKYFIEYENSSPENGDLIYSKNNRVPIKDKVARFYFVLYEEDKPENLLDYRDYRLTKSYMDTAVLDVEYEEENIDYWIAMGESDKVEFKLKIEDEPTKKDFLKSVCSFANTYGGQIFIGVDDNSNVKGIEKKDAEKYQDMLSDLIRRWIEPQIKIKTNDVDFRGSKIIVVHIPKGDSPPYNLIDAGVYIRANSTDRVARRDEILELASQKTNQNFYK